MLKHIQMLRTGLCGAVLWSIALPLWSCPLNPASITQIFETTPMLEQRSQLPGRCDYSWARQDQPELQGANAASLKQGAGKYTSTAPLWNQLVLEQYQTTVSAAAAIKALQKITRNGPEPKFGSPDPLKGLGFETLSETAAWDKQANVLLFAKGRHLYRLQLKVFSFAPEMLQAKALAVSEALSLTEGN